MHENTISKRYHLTQKLGEGGMGTVYHAHDRLTGQAVALKLVNANPVNLHTNSRSSNPSNDPNLSLAHEFQMMASLRHPHIITVLDYGFGCDSQPFFTMTLLENAQTFLQAAHNQTLKTKVELTIQVLQALAYIPGRDILHRDLKPSNVLVKDGHARVADFGLAQTPDDAHAGIAGTLAYMSPEVLMGDPPSKASDLFALGVMLYEIISGKHPFVKDNITETITAILSQDPLWDALDVSLDLVMVIQRLLEKSPADRYQTATEVIQALSEALEIPLSAETSDIRESFIQAARFVGRETELAQLRMSVDKIVEASKFPLRGDTDQAVGARWLIGGESGVGKSRLVEEVRIRALVHGVMVVRGQAITEGGLPYHLWRELLKRMVLMVDIDDQDLSVLKEIVPDLPTLLERDIADYPNADDRITFQKRLFSAVEEVFRKTLSVMPVLLIAEDLQWASESLTLLKEVSQLAFDHPLMVIGVYRDDERPNLSSELPDFNHIALNRLNTAEITRLSQSILGDMGERPQVIDLLERETEGNVFFLVEVVRALAEDAGSLADIGTATLPSQIFAGGIKRIVDYRLNRISEPSRELLNRVAVAGRQIDRKIIAVITPDVDIEAWLTECVNAAVLNVADGIYRFAHDKLREGVLLHLTDDQTRVYNAQVASAIETVYMDTIESFAGVLAQHYYKADNPQKEAHYAFIAAKQAESAYDHAESRRLYERLLAMHAEQFSDNPTVYLAKIYHGLGRAYYGVSDFENVLLWQTKSLELAKQADNLFAIAEAEHAIGEAHFRQGNYDNAVQWTQASLEHYQQLGEHKKATYSLMSLGVVQARTGALQDAIKTNLQALEQMKRTDDEIAIARSMNNYAICIDMSGDYDRALEIYHETLAIRRRINDRSGISYSLNNIGAVLTDMKRYDEAITYLMEARKYMLPIGEKLAIATNAASIGDLNRDMGNFEEARRWHMESLKIRQRINDKPGLVNSYRALGRLELGENNPSVAWDWLELIMALIDPASTDQNFIKRDVVLLAYDILKHIQADAKVLELAIVLRNDLLNRNYPVDRFDKDIAELQHKLGDAYETIRTQADNQTLDTVIEKLYDEYKPNFQDT